MMVGHRPLRGLGPPYKPARTKPIVQGASECNRNAEHGASDADGPGRRVANDVARREIEDEFLALIRTDRIGQRIRIKRAEVALSPTATIDPFLETKIDDEVVDAIRTE